MYPNCQHHYFCALGSLLSKVRVTGTMVPLITGVATQYLMGGRAGQMDDSCSGQDRTGQPELSSVPRKGVQGKNYNLFISEIFLFTFLDHSCLQVTETSERNTADREGSCIGCRWEASFRKAGPSVTEQEDFPKFFCCFYEESLNLECWCSGQI